MAVTQWPLVPVLGIFLWSNSGNFATLSAIRRASSRSNNFAAEVKAALWRCEGDQRVLLIAHLISKLPPMSRIGETQGN
jgi:hypothetical protein